VWFFTIDMMVKALNELLAARERVKADAYEITGISDIIRGASDPDETLGAQQLKAQSSSIRIKDKQKNFADFVRGALRIGSDIIVNHFQPETIAEISDIRTIPEANHVKGPNGQWMDPKELQALMQAQMQQQMPAQGMTPGAPQGGPVPPAPGAPPMMAGVPQGIPIMGHNGGPPMPGETLAQAAIALLKDPLQRNFRIDIETDSTVALDENTEKQARIEFVTAIGQFLGSSMEIAATPMGAELGPLLGEILLFAVRGFKVGTQLEGAIENAIERLNEKAKNPPPPQPDPAMIKAQADAEARKQEAQLDAQKMQQEGQLAAQNHQMEAQARQEEIRADQISRQGEMVAEQQRAGIDAQKGKIELAKAMIGLQTAKAAANKPKPTNGAGK
jgi:hypothetical protein